MREVFEARHAPDVADDLLAVLAQPWAPFEPKPGEHLAWGIAAAAGIQLISGIIQGNQAKAAQASAQDAAAQQSRDAFNQQTAYIQQQEAAQRAALSGVGAMGNPYFQATGLLRQPNPNQYAMPGGGGQIFAGGSGVAHMPIQPPHAAAPPPTPTPTPAQTQRAPGGGGEQRNMNVPDGPAGPTTPNMPTDGSGTAITGFPGMTGDPGAGAQYGVLGQVAAQAAPGSNAGMTQVGMNQGSGVYTMPGAPGPNPSFQPAAHGYYFTGDSGNGQPGSGVPAVWAPTKEAAEALWVQQHPQAQSFAPSMPNSSSAQAPPPMAPTPPQGVPRNALAAQRFPGLLATGGTLPPRALRSNMAGA